MSRNKIAPRIQAGWKERSYKLRLIKTASPFNELKENFRITSPGCLQTLVGACIHFLVPSMEDEELSEESAWNLREMERKNRTDQNSRPPTDQHVNGDPPLRGVCGSANPSQVTQRCDQNAGTRSNGFVFHDFQKCSGELGKTGIFHPNDFQTTFSNRTWQSCHKVLIRENKTRGSIPPPPSHSVRRYT